MRAHLWHRVVSPCISVDERMGRGKLHWIWPIDFEINLVPVSQSADSLAGWQKWRLSQMRERVRWVRVHVSARRINLALSQYLETQLAVCGAEKATLRPDYPPDLKWSLFITPSALQKIASGFWSAENEKSWLGPRARCSLHSAQKQLKSPHFWDSLNGVHWKFH